MKKFLLFTVLTFSFLSTNITQLWADCNYNRNSDIVDNLQGCLWETDLVDPGDGIIEWDIKQKFIFWTNTLATALSLVAIGAIVYGGFLMTISVWEEEKIKKGKDIVKWSLIGFLASISAGAVVRLVIELVFALAG